jgi:hypothetical protein
MTREIITRLVILGALSASASVHASDGEDQRETERILRERAAERDEMGERSFVEAVSIRLKKNRALSYEQRTVMDPTTAATLSAFVGLQLTPDRSFGAGFERLRLPRKMNQREVRAVCAKLQTHPEVDSCTSEMLSIDVQATPNDSRFPDQFAAPGSFRSASIDRILSY